MHSKWIVLWIIAACTLAACSRQEAGWRDAERDDSIAAYQQYLQDFPAGSHAGQAEARVLELRELNAWTLANRLRTPEAWQHYLGEWPDGRHAPAARRQLIQFVPVAIAASADAYAVQLGAYSNEAAAYADQRRLASEHAAVLADAEWRILAPIDGPAGLWRLRTGRLGEKAARDLCDRLRTLGVDCVAVPDESAGHTPP